jgi:hypothetical protein
MLTGNLEYLISSLPNLSFSNSEATQHDVKGLFQKYASNVDADQDLVATLQDDASKYLSASDFKKFQSINLKNIHQKQFQDSSIEVVAQFSKFMYGLKSELKMFRENRKSEEPLGKINYEFIDDLPNNPLQAEEYLLNLQWQKLDALSIGHYADLSALILYKLKLQVLQRLWQFDAKLGFKVFQNSLKVA